ncbi:MAG: hypothetical protein ACLR6J_06345 [Parabacteroides merdae]
MKGFSQLVADNQLEGILATAWDDGSPHLEAVWRGFIAQGEFGWNPSARDIEARLKKHMHSGNMVFARRITGWPFWMNWRRRSFSRWRVGDFGRR